MDLLGRVTKNVIAPIVLLWLGFISGILFSSDFLNQYCATTDYSCKMLYGSAFPLVVVVLVYLIASIWLLISKIFSIGRIRLQIAEGVRELIYTSDFIGSSIGAGIRIINNNDFSIHDCSATIEEKVQLIYREGKLVPSPNPSALFGFSPLGNLIWNNLNRAECKIDIPAKSKENVLLIANILIGVRTKEPQKQADLNPLMVFNFALCPFNPLQINDYGLYKIRLRVNGRKVDRELVEHFDGYLFSANVPSESLPVPSQNIFVHVFRGDPLRDPHVRKHLLKN